MKRRMERPLALAQGAVCSLSAAAGRPGEFTIPRRGDNLLTGINPGGAYSVDRIHAVARLSAYSFQRLPVWAAVHRSLHPVCTR